MRPPRLECRWWGDVQWPRLARGLSFSAREHNPDWEVNVRRIKMTQGIQAGDKLHVRQQGPPIFICGLDPTPEQFEEWAKRAAVERLRRRPGVFPPPPAICKTCRRLASQIYGMEVMPPSPLGVPSHSANTAKMTVWKKIIEDSEDGDRVLLVDADTMVLRSMSDLWDRDFDMAITTKPHARFPFNSGVVFLRVGPKTREFIRAWEAENVRLLNSPREHQRWRARYGGVNQAALGAMLDCGIVARMDMKIVELPCREWNNEDSSWDQFATANPRLVHLKSGLRQCVFSGVAPKDEYQPIVDAWRSIDRRAAEAQERAYQERQATA